MPKKPYYLGLIPARGGSKRIPHKNLVSFGGKPLIEYTLCAARASKMLTHTIVSTDDPRIARYAQRRGTDVPFLRPAALSRDNSSSLDAILHALSYVESKGIHVDAVVLLQPTSPLRTARHIDEALHLFETSRADTLTAVTELPHHPFHAWKLNSSGTLSTFSPLRYQAITKKYLPKAVTENGVLYVIKTAVLRKKKFYGKRIIPYMMDSAYALDIDTRDDLAWGEYLLKAKKR